MHGLGTFIWLARYNSWFSPPASSASGSPGQEQPKLLLCSFLLLSMLRADGPLPTVHMDQIFQLFLKPSQMFHSLCEASSSEVLKRMVEVPEFSIISAPRWSIERSVSCLSWQKFPEFVTEFYHKYHTTILSPGLTVSVSFLAATKKPTD